MTETNSLNREQLQSKVISFLRFPLIVAVVLIHVQFLEIDGIKARIGAPEPFYGTFPVYENVLYLFAQILARVAVPLFFFFSGFLFYYKSGGFTKSIYIQKIKKRFRTLLLPYVIWNILYFLLHVIQWEAIFECNKRLLVKGFSFSDCLMMFWDYNNRDAPISYQFWFIRDLMVVVLLTPIIYLLTKKFGAIFLVILGILWFLGIGRDFNGCKIDAFFFFSLGAFFSIKKKNFVEIVKPNIALWGVLYFIFVLISLFFKNYNFHVYTIQTSIIIGIAFAIALSAIQIERKKWKVNIFLSESSFFIYAYHVIALPILLHIPMVLIPLNSDLHATILYFLWAIVTIIVGLVAFYGLKKHFPIITSFLTGGR